MEHSARTSIHRRNRRQDEQQTKVVFGLFALVANCNNHENKPQSWKVTCFWQQGDVRSWRIANATSCVPDMGLCLALVYPKKFSTTILCHVGSPCWFLRSENGLCGKAVDDEDDELVPWRPGFGCLLESFAEERKQSG